MSIRTIYTELPKFSPTDQEPTASRVQIGSLWVDYTGTVPTQTDVDAFFAPSPDDIRKSSFKADANYQAMLAQLKQATPAQMQTYINNNVTDLASAKVMLVKFALVLALVANGS